MAAKLRKCPKGTRRNPKTRRCQPKRRPRRKVAVKRTARVVKRRPRARKVRKVVTRYVRRYVPAADPYHPYVPRGVHNPDTQWGLNFDMGRLKLNSPTRCGGRYRHACDASPSCRWNEFRNHCEARPEVFAGQRFEGPHNRI